MKKNNNQGFVLAEALIVSTFILGVLVFLFVQIRNIINSYDRSFDYNTVTGLYFAHEIDKFIKDNDYDELMAHVVETGYMVINDECNCYLRDKEALLFTWNNMLEQAEIENVIIISKNKNNIAGIKEFIDSSVGNIMGEKLTINCKKYLKSLNLDTESNNNRIVIEFINGTFASIEI